VLTEASISGKVEPPSLKLRRPGQGRGQRYGSLAGCGDPASTRTGRLIPAGTGFEYSTNSEVSAEPPRVNDAGGVDDIGGGEFGQAAACINWPGTVANRVGVAREPRQRHACITSRSGRLKSARVAVFEVIPSPR
jgi:hypothetical protein